MRRSTLALLAATACLSACSARSVSTTIDPDVITYEYDARAKVCIGVVGRQNPGLFNWLFGKADSFSVFSTPCTDEVMKLARRG